MRGFGFSSAATHYHLTFTTECIHNVFYKLVLPLVTSARRFDHKRDDETKNWRNVAMAAIWLHTSRCAKTREDWGPFCFFWAATERKVNAPSRASNIKFLFFYVIFFMAYENLATILTFLNSTDEGLGPKSLETELIGTLSLGKGGRATKSGCGSGRSCNHLDWSKVRKLIGHLH